MDMILHHATVSSENSKKLTCSKCKKLLSRFPIYMHLKFLHYVCGRCVTDMPDLSDYTRNVAYEQIAECIRFDCCHTPEGCLWRLFPSEMEDHEEKHCNYLKYNCALGKGLCSWYGFHHEYLDRVKENHNDLLLNGKHLEIDLKKNYEMQYLLANGEELFLVKIQNCFILKKFSCVVYCITKSFNTENVYYKLEFSDLNDKYKLHIFQKVNEIYQVSDNGLGLAFCNDEIIHLRVLHVLEVNNKDKENIERPFECPVCLELFLPPIYLCETGHSICEHCKKSVESECPLCKKRIVNIRNFALEDIVLNKVMSCKNSNCTFTGKGSDIEKHQEWCDKRLASCFYFCVNNKSFMCNDSIKVCEIYNHVVSKHKSCILEIDRASQSFIITKANAIWALKYMSRLFKLHTFRSSNLDSVCWSLQLPSNDEHCKRFKFVVKINIGENSRCLEGPCIPIQQSKYSSDTQKFVNSHIAYKDICYPVNVTILERKK